MFIERLLRIWKFHARPARCRYCLAPIVWVITARGKHLPLNPGYDIWREETNPETGAVYELVHRDAVHFSTCERRPPATRARAPKRWIQRRPLLEIADHG